MIGMFLKLRNSPIELPLEMLFNLKALRKEIIQNPAEGRNPEAMILNPFLLTKVFNADCEKILKCLGKW